MYICTEDVFPNLRLQQLIAQQRHLRTDVPGDVVDRIKFGNQIFIKHVADVVSVSLALSSEGTGGQSHTRDPRPPPVPVSREARARACMLHVQIHTIQYLKFKSDQASSRTCHPHPQGVGGGGPPGTRMPSMPPPVPGQPAVPAAQGTGPAVQASHPSQSSLCRVLLLLLTEPPNLARA